MTASRDPDRLIHQFLLEGEEQLRDQVYDVVRAEIEQKRQRAMLGPWRLPTVNKFVTIGLGVAAVVVLVFVGALGFIPLLGLCTGLQATGHVDPTCGILISGRDQELRIKQLLEHPLPRIIALQTPNTSYAIVRVQEDTVEVGGVWAAVDTQRDDRAAVPAMRVFRHR